MNNSVDMQKFIVCTGVAMLLAAGMLQRAMSQERQVIKDNHGRVVRIIKTRNDGSKTVTDASGRVLEIIRTDNSGRTRISDSNGVVQEIVEPRDTARYNESRNDALQQGDDAWSF